MNRFIRKELVYGAKNYKPLDVCIKNGKGIYVRDVNSKLYMDFISGYSALNQGHCHPRLVNVIKEQSKKLTLTSRAMYNNVLGDFMEKVCKTFNYSKMLPMNTGVEGGETAIKIARKWGYLKKGVEPNKAINLFCNNNFWGRTLAAASSSSDPDCYNEFGPFMRGFKLVDYNDIDKLEKTFKKYPNIVSFMLEPIQGEAGIIIPDDDYLVNVRKLCTKYNVLMIADEVQTGLGRTGKMLACDYSKTSEYIKMKPDILILGKALSGGFLPVSAVLSKDKIMEVITPGTHGSTYGGNPLASAIGIEAINIIEDEELVENSYKQGNYFRKSINDLQFPSIKECRGKGLLNAIEFHNEKDADKFVNNLISNGILAKSTHRNTIRLSPPLIINQEEMDKALHLIKLSLV